jgi:hypothetical protein
MLATGLKAGMGGNDIGIPFLLQHNVIEPDKFEIIVSI